MECFKNDIHAKMMQGMGKLMIEFNPQVEEYIKQEKPDAWIHDHMLLLPAAYKAGIPWILVCSASPSFYYDSTDLPPPGSGKF